MSDIRLRAWNKVAKRMFMVNDISGMLQNTIVSCEHSGFRDCVKTKVCCKHGDACSCMEGIEGWEDEVELMQYIGRKDKNGEEIYRGDMIKRISLEPEYDDTGLPGGTYVAGYRLKEKIFVASMELNYDNPLLGVAYYPEVGEDFLDEDKEAYAEELNLVGDYIIGNIYENPELLKRGEHQ
jgi:uncharacterized phage protein (TIGR01671 family)